MKTYYFDNSATSNPKPQEVYEAVNYAMRELNSNPGRGGHRLAVKSAMEIYRVREKIAKFFNQKNPLQVAFTNNSTTALNMAIFGVLKEGDSVITTSQEHNSTLRPIYTLKKERGINVILVEDDDPEDKIIEIIKKEKIKMVALNHMSNVTGKTIDIGKIGKITRENGVILVVDASQSAGMIEVDMEKMFIDVLCLTGHKSLFGIQGIGAIIPKEGIDIKSLLVGGTGSHSRVLLQPEEMPEHLEAGTVNTPGIISLGAGIDFINKIGIKNIQKHEQILKDKFIKGIKELDIKNIIEIYSSYGKNDGPVVSLNIKGIASSDLSALLDEEFAIITRSGLHCAPLVHQKNNTTERGMVRFSFGYFNTEEEIQYALEAISEIINSLNS
ncbi:MAG: aminotransferase class V-fold PLP-dependent enzyme [Fusobacteriaceae bacterium]